MTPEEFMETVALAPHPLDSEMEERFAPLRPVMEDMILENAFRKSPFERMFNE
jgi:hypothetical protein